MIIPALAVLGLLLTALRIGSGDPLLPAAMVLSSAALLLAVPCLALARSKREPEPAAAAADEDKQRIEELNELNSAIIASLATAIDAKDDYSRTHVNRAQIYAVALAEAIGLEGPELEAVRTGSLIHDIGKLGIPERILGKPGKLTPDEFTRMKAHVDIGVEILAPVRFPYPVRPIVEAHHERWDGLGYPKGLRGEDIPIGGRIMALADVFDALTSTRPYRSALSFNDAAQIVREGAGRQFDPTLVEAFMRILPEVRGRVGEPEEGDFAADGANPGSVDDSSALAMISQAAAEMSATCELAQGLAQTSTVRDVAEVVVDRALRLLPAQTAVLYLAEEGAMLRAEGVAGLHAERLTGLSVNRGEGVAGWVAETLQPQINAQASLDLARRFSPHQPLELSGAAAVPLAQGGATIGVLAIYTTAFGTLTERHLAVLNVMAEHATAALVSARRYETSRELSLTDPLTGLANSRSLFQTVEELCAQSNRHGVTRAADRFAVLMFDLDGFKQVNDHLGHLRGDELLRDFADILRRLSREGDLPCRYAGDEFVVVLSHAVPETAQAFARRVREALVQSSQRWSAIQIGVSVGAACFPPDGSDVQSLLAVADERMYADKFSRSARNLADRS